LLAVGVVLGLFTWLGAVRPPWQAPIVYRGASPTLLILALYGAMLLGMLSHYMYFRWSRPRSRRGTLDLGNLLAPVFVSPIVFLPLASVFQSSAPATADAARLMLFLVAFENGFFWREFFENRQKLQSEGTE
jgi:hypothetical protein